MDWIGSLFLALAVAFLVGIYVSRPFFTRQAGSARRSADQVDTDETERRRSTLLAQHERALTALQDLEFDNTLGKIPAEDYPEQRAFLLQSGAEALRQLDIIEGKPALDATAEDRLEAVVAARRADGHLRAGNGSAPSRRRPLVETGDDLEEVIAERRRARQEKSAGFCPKCGKPLQKSDRFCPRCGVTL